MLTLPIVTGVQKWQSFADAAVRSSRRRAGRTRTPPRSRDSGSTPVARRLRPSSTDAATRRRCSVAPGSCGAPRVEPCCRRCCSCGCRASRCSACGCSPGGCWVQRLRTHGVTPAGDSWQRWRSASRAACTSRARSRCSNRRRVDVPTVDRLAQAGRAAAGERAGRPVAAAARGDPRARARAHPPPRLPGQPAADARRDAALLSPGGLVAVGTHPRRARELLRRSRRQPVRRSGRLRQRARRSRGAASGRTPLALAANGGSLLQRVRRLLGAPASHAGRGPAWLAGTAAALLVAGLALGADGLAQAPTRRNLKGAGRDVNRTGSPAQGTGRSCTSPRADSARKPEVSDPDALKARCSRRNWQSRRPPRPPSPICRLSNRRSQRPRPPSRR